MMDYEGLTRYYPVVWSEKGGDFFTWKWREETGWLWAKLDDAETNTLLPLLVRQHVRRNE